MSPIIDTGDDLFLLNATRLSSDHKDLDTEGTLATLLGRGVTMKIFLNILFCEQDTLLLTNGPIGLMSMIEIVVALGMDLILIKEGIYLIIILKDFELFMVSYYKFIKVFRLFFTRERME